MSIEPTRTSGISPAQSQGSQGVAARRASGPMAAAPLAASSTAHLQGLGASDASQDINSARVAAIRQAIADGSLTFDAGRIADGILASARELLA